MIKKRVMKIMKIILIMINRINYFFINNIIYLFMIVYIKIIINNEY